MRYSMVNSSEGASTIVLMDDEGDTTTVTETHPNYVRVATALIENTDPTRWLTTDVNLFLAAFEDEDETDEVEDLVPVVADRLSETIERYRAEGRSVSNLVNFTKRLAKNPSQYSRDQLFNWTQTKDLTIDAEGFIIGYKGVRTRTSDEDFLDEDGNPLFSLEDFPYASVSAGLGIINDIHEINGHLPMGVGARIEMPREAVNANPSVGCSTGLHVGTFDYAKGYASSGAMLEVKFDPADVVSVPSDCGFAKLRCCRYEVVAIHEDAVDDLTTYEPESTWDEEEALGDIEAFMDFQPTGWFARLKARRNRKGEA